MDIGAIAGETSQILGAVGAFVGLVALFRRTGRTQRIAQDASDKAGNAAKESVRTRTATHETSADVVALADDLAQARVELVETRNAMVRMADQADSILTAHLHGLLLLRNDRVPERVMRLEEWAQNVSTKNNRPAPQDTPLPPEDPDDDEPIVTTGRHRFPTVVIQTIDQEQNQ